MYTESERNKIQPTSAPNYFVVMTYIENENIQASRRAVTPTAATEA